MKYKIGDRVRIKNFDWFRNGACNGFNAFMPKYCGEVFTIKSKNETLQVYYMIEDGGTNAWTDEMIEGLVEEETLIERVDDNGLPFNEWLSHKGAFYIPDGYELKDENGNIINATKIVLEKKKKEYPTTIEECCKILGLEFNPFYTGVKRQVNYKDGLLHNLKCLLIYRDAYWKIAGEEMGLGKPWEPNWDAKDRCFYTIHTFNGEIDCSGTAHRNAVLIFPTEEMRYAFYENFKELIESCKELL